MAKRVGVLTGGGDCPGLNAVIRAVTRRSLDRGYDVVGVRDGWRGLVDGRFQALGAREISGILPRGGTILGTTRTNPYKSDHGVKRVLSHFDEQELTALVVIGGEDTLGVASRLFEEEGLPVVGVPKTIDNDLAATELTFGFMTALDIATEALDRLHTTAESHDRAMVLEVMGRHAGWIALHSGVSGGADVILIPEIPFCVKKVSEKVIERDRCDSQFSIIVVAEGAKEIEGREVYQDMGDRQSSPRLGGMGHHVAHEVGRITSKETRCVVLGHLQRGGSPNAFDRMLATNFGSAAVRALQRGKRGVMVSLQAANIRTVPIAEAIANIKQVQPESQLVRTARDVGVSFGALNEDDYHKYENC